ncbi:MAG: TetR/AcrR family transcriptional regulator [Methanobacterium sp.]
MTDETEQKILDAALTVFAEKGYDGAKIRVIANKSGFTEVTVFNKFKTKRNLYNMIAVRNIDKLTEDFSSILKNYRCETPEAFLRTFIKDLAKMFSDNFEFLHLAIQEASKSQEQVEKEFINILTEYIKKNIQNDKIDYQALALTIFSFTYMYNLNKYKDRTYVDLDTILERFINNIVMCIQ